MIKKPFNILMPFSLTLKRIAAQVCVISSMLPCASVYSISLPSDEHDLQNKAAETVCKLTKESRSSRSLRGAKIMTQVWSSLKHAYVPNSNNELQTRRRRETSVRVVEGSHTFNSCIKRVQVY